MSDLPSRTGDTSNAAWLHEVMQHAAKANRAGDSAEVERIRAHVLAEGGPQLLNIVDEAFRGAALAQGLTLMQVPGVRSRWGRRCRATSCVTSARVRR